MAGNLHGGANSSSAPGDGEATTTGERKHGGWITVPFITASVAGLTLAAGGWMQNLLILLIKEFNVKTINAAQINNVVLGCTGFFPLIGAILADSFLGCFPLIWLSSLLSLLGLILLTLAVTIDGLRPPICEIGSSSNCAEDPSRLQYVVLIAALGLLTIGVGGSRYTLATIGANQFAKHDHQSTSSYFNWYFSALYASLFLSSTVLVYIEDNVGWAWGLGICIVANVIGLAMFLAGQRYYYKDKPQGSPVTNLFRVIVATFRKRNAQIPPHDDQLGVHHHYYYGDDDDEIHKGRINPEPPTTRFRVLNRAALKTDGDTIQPKGGSRITQWKLCTVQQVEDLKSIIGILPLWSTSILLAAPIGIQLTLTIFQAITTDRHLSSRFQVPPSSMLVFSFIATAISVTLLDHILRPLWKKAARGRNPTPLQLMGVGHVFNIAGMALSALVEPTRRARHLRGQPMSVLWLVPQMVIVGFGEGFHFPGQVVLYYQEFPASLKSIATAMVALLIAVGYYISLAFIDLLRRATDWLPDDIDQGRLDNVYWVMVVLGVLNFGYFLVCCWFYKYKNVDAWKGGFKSIWTNEDDRQV